MALRGEPPSMALRGEPPWDTVRKKRTQERIITSYFTGPFTLARGAPILILLGSQVLLLIWLVLSPSVRSLG